MTESNPTNFVKPGPTVIRQTIKPDLGERVNPADRKVLNPRFGLSISCATNEANPRNFDDGLWESHGPADWYQNRLAPQIIASDAGTIFLRNPGGMEPTGGLLLFDQLSRCCDQSGTMPDMATASKVRAIGEASEWAWVCGEIRKLGRCVALYLGAVKNWDHLGTGAICYQALKELAPFEGCIDELYIDCGNEATQFGAYPVVARVAHDMGIVCGAENRPLTGRYSHLMGHPHVVKGSYWDTTGNAGGRDEFAPILPNVTCWIFSDEKDPGAINAARYMREVGRVAVGFGEGFLSTDLEVHP